MSISKLEIKGHMGSDRECLEVIEGSTTKIHNVFDKLTTTLIKLRMALNVTNHEREERESKRAIETMKKETNASFKRLETMMIKIKGQGTTPSSKMHGHDAFDERARASVTTFMHAP